MKMIKLLSFALAVVLLFGSFVGCESDNDDQSTDGKTDASEGVGTGTDASEEIGAQIGAVPENEKVSYSSFPEKLTATKIGSVNKSEIYNLGDGGIYYKENGKYGIMTYDGSKDTGAKYAYCSSNGKYFEVVTNMPTDTTSLSSMNCMGLANVNGDLIVPEKYCSVRVLNDRFAQAYEVTGTTDSKDDALIYSSNSNIISIYPSEDDDFFTGNWYIYDLTTGRKVPNATGTKPYANTATGGYVKYYTDDREQYCVNGEGEVLPAGTVLFDNGCYRTTEGNQGIVYDIDGNKLFSYEQNSFVPKYVDGEYFIGVKNDVDDKYVVIDRSGSVVSAEFNARPYVAGKLVYVDSDLYQYEIFDFKGNKLIDGKYEYVYSDDQLGTACILENDKEFTFIKDDGTVIYKGTENDTLSYNNGYFTINKETDDGYLYYSIKDKKFTINGHSAYAPWLVEVDGANFTKDVVDTISGKSIISGYAGYQYVSIAGSVTYVYAEKNGGGYDIYTVK